MSNVTHTRMIKHLPKYERNSELINAILHSLALKVDNTSSTIHQTYCELFIDTAVETIKLHERDLNITYDNDLTLQQRRELVIANYRATLDQTTEETIKSVASAFSNGEVEINPTDVVGVFEIKFVGAVGIPDNMQGLMNTIDTVLPAHLDVVYTYMFNVWNNVETLTWNNVSNFTWDDLLNEELI